MPENINVSNRIQGYFCSYIVFDLSKKCEMEIKALEKGLDFDPIHMILLIRGVLCFYNQTNKYNLKIILIVRFSS